MKNLETFVLDSWDSSIPASMQQKVIQSLEDGKIIYLPNLAFRFEPDEHYLLSPTIADPKSKNISYNIHHDTLGGCMGSETFAQQLKEMMKRFATDSRTLLEKLCPLYIPFLIQSRTSYRPIEIAGRKSSYRKDDTLLHVDSFPATPIKGNRILRFFTNINPDGKPRVWRVGEPFPNVVSKIAPRAKRPFPGISLLLKWLKITKDYRSFYDHYMLQIHDIMKGDQNYQATVAHEEIHFPPGSSWIVYTDQVSHAAMSGQHVLEQTFYLPAHAMNNPATTPLAILEKHFNQKLV